MTEHDDPGQDDPGQEDCSEDWTGEYDEQLMTPFSAVDSEAAISVALGQLASRRRLEADGGPMHKLCLLGTLAGEVERQLAWQMQIARKNGLSPAMIAKLSGISPPRARRLVAEAERREAERLARLAEWPEPAA